MATGGQDNTNDEISSDMVGGCVTLRSCEPCMKDNTSTGATQFCTVCNEFLCDDCKRGHSRFKSGKHSFINAKDVTEVPAVVDMKDMDKCEEHKKKIKFFCKDHSLLCCSTCAFIHRTCKNVDELAKISEEKGELLHDLKTDLVKAAEGGSMIITDCKQTKRGLEEKLIELPKEINDLREKLNTMCADAITLINNQAKVFIDDESKRLSERQTSWEKVLQDINDIIPVCSAVVDNGTPQQVFILARSIEKKLTEIRMHADEQKRKHFTLQLSLTFSKEILTLLQTGGEFVKLDAFHQISLADQKEDNHVDTDKKNVSTVIDDTRTHSVYSRGQSTAGQLKTGDDSVSRDTEVFGMGVIIGMRLLVNEVLEVKPTSTETSVAKSTGITCAKCNINCRDYFAFINHRINCK